MPQLPNAPTWLGTPPHHGGGVMTERAEVGAETDAIALTDTTTASDREQLAAYRIQNSPEGPTGTRPASKLNEGMFTSARLDWATPQSFFDLVDAEFGFTLDSAAQAHNAKCGWFYTEAEDGLSQPWPGVVWCNPPYGRELAKWVEKGYREAQNGSTVVMLIPARTDTAYWHDYVMRAAELRLLRGRLVFGSGDARANAPFPSALVVFRPGEHATVVSTMGRGELTRRAS